MTDWIILLLRVFFLMILVTGLVIVFRPELLFLRLEKYAATVALHLAAVFFRLILGIMLLFTAEQTRFPVVTEVIGYLAVIAGLGIFFIGRHKFSRLILWLLPKAKKWHPLGGIVATAFAAFLFYSLS